MKSSLFLFIFTFFPFALVNENIKINKEEIQHFVSSQSVKGKVIDSLSLWFTAEARFYNPLDSNQTKTNPDGLGTSGRKIGHGSIAFGAKFAALLVEEGVEVFIQFKDLNIVTPFGKGIFRIDDKMGDDYCQKIGEYHVDFFHKDLSPKLKCKGHFLVSFRLLIKNRDGSFRVVFSLMKLVFFL